MTAQVDPYVRVYYRIIDDPKFADVFDDKTALGWWLTLLIGADATYPAPAHLPRKLRETTLTKLTDAGLIDLLPGERYRVHGLAKEREARAESARFAADAKHHGHAEALRRQSERNAERMRTASERDAEPLPLRSAPLRTNPIQSAPTPAGRVRLGSMNSGETTEEKLARYRAVIADPSKSAEVKAAAKVALEALPN